MSTLKYATENEIRKDTLPDDAPVAAHRILAFWHAHAGPGNVPSRNDFSPDNLADWLEDVSLYEYHPDKDDFQILFEGENIVELTGEDWRGAFAREVDCHFSTALHTALTDARKTGKPQIHQLQIFQKEWRSGVRILLPVVLQKKGQPDVDQVFLSIFPVKEMMS
jgi:hypothetical protein